MTALDSVPVSLPLAPGVGHSTNADFLRRFGRSLAGVSITRHATRTRYDRQAPMCFGMNSIHFFVNGQRTFQMSGQDSEVKHPVGLAANEEFFTIDEVDVQLRRKLPT